MKPLHRLLPWSPGRRTVAAAELPDEATEPVPTTSLVQAPSKLVAGARAWCAEVLDQFGEALSGQTISVAVQTDSEDLGLVPPLGNACTTGLSGEPCDLVLRSEGQVGVFAVQLTSGNVEPKRLEVQVTPAVDALRLTLQLPGRPLVEFRNGQRNALAFGDPVSLLAGAAPVAVNLRLTDRYGNPVPAALTAEVLAQPAHPRGGADAWTQRSGGWRRGDGGGAAADAAQSGGADSGREGRTTTADAAPADAGEAATPRRAMPAAAGAEQRCAWRWAATASEHPS